MRLAARNGKGELMAGEAREDEQGRAIAEGIQAASTLITSDEC
jgi:hypothetical protein